MSTRSLRVVYLGHSAALSGAELGLVDMLPAFEDVEPHVILAEDGPIVERLRAQQIHVEVVPLGTRTRRVPRARLDAAAWKLAPVAAASAAYSVRLAQHLRRLRADVVEANTLKAFVYGAPASRLASTPFIWRVHDRIAEDYLPPAAIHLLLAIARATAAGVIANSEATLTSLGRLDAVPTTVVHEPVESMSFTRGPIHTSAPFTVAMVGRLAPWKGQDLFLRAFAAAFPGGEERATIVGAPLFGEEAFELSLRRQILELGLEQRVELIGFRDDVSAELRRADALVHASLIPEPFGRVVVEGMAAGLPVIAADAGGPREIITDGVDGVLYRPGDATALAQALIRVARDRPFAAALGRAATEHARRYSPAATARSTTAFYRRVLAAEGVAA
jgi:glycosyltransferase involved in cell wall biosynthesis